MQEIFKALQLTDDREDGLHWRGSELTADEGVLRRKDQPPSSGDGGDIFCHFHDLAQSAARSFVRALASISFRRLT